MVRLGVIAGNAFREVLHERIIYSVFIIMILVGLVTASPMAMLHMASEAGETKIAEQLSGGVVTSLLGLWSSAALVLAAILGSAAVSNEVRTKTIVTVLSRPVSRGELLVGKWLGIESFVIAFMLLGIGIACVFAAYFAIQLSLLFWMAALEMLVNILLVGAASVALGVFVPRGVASIVALSLQHLGSVAQLFLHASFGPVAAVVYFLVPAVMPIHLLDASLGKEMLDPQYGLYAAVLSENSLYACMVMLLATMLFARREIRLG